jgi:hypothetical protein
MLPYRSIEFRYPDTRLISRYLKTTNSGSHGAPTAPAPAPEPASALLFALAMFGTLSIIRRRPRR